MEPNSFNSDKRDTTNNTLIQFLEAWNKVFQRYYQALIMKEQVSQLAKSAVVQYVSESIIYIYRRTEVQNKTIARETDNYNYLLKWHGY